MLFLTLYMRIAIYVLSVVAGFVESDPDKIVIDHRTNVYHNIQPLVLFLGCPQVRLESRASTAKIPYEMTVG